MARARAKPRSVFNKTHEGEGLQSDFGLGLAFAIPPRRSRDLEKIGQELEEL